MKSKVLLSTMLVALITPGPLFAQTSDRTPVRTKNTRTRTTVSSTTAGTTANAKTTNRAATNAPAASDAATPSQSSSTEAASTAQVQTTAAAPAPSPWMFILSSMVDFKNVETKGLHFTTAVINYTLSPMFSFAAVTAYSGSLAPKNGINDAVWWDAELGFSANIPLSAKEAANQWTLGLGTGLVFPTTSSSYDSSMVGGWKVDGSLSLARAKWSLGFDNSLYLYTYRTQAPLVIEPLSIETPFDEQSTPSAAPQAYAASLHKLGIGYGITSKLRASSSVLVQSVTAGDSDPMYSLLAFGGVSYQAASFLSLTTGVASSRSLSTPNAHPMFSEKTTAYRIVMNLML